MNLYWDKIPPEYKRTVVISLSILVVGIMIYFLTPSQQTHISKKNDETITHLLTDTNTRDINMNNLSAKLKQFERQAERLEKEIEQLKQQLKPGVGKGEFEKFNTTTSSSNQEIIKDMMLDTTSKGGDSALLKVPFMNSEPASDLGLAQSNSQIIQPNKTGTVLNSSTIVDELQLSAIYPDADVLNQGFLEGLHIQGAIEKSELTHLPTHDFGHSIFNQSHSESSEMVPEFGNQSIRTLEAPILSKEDFLSPSLKLLAGSIISGTLITGMDAPTHDMARKEPFPALLRIEKEAILPNHHTSDIRFCFLVMGGYGDLSSERAYLRAETLSCIFENERVVETALEAYAVGEDGKTGIRGRLVSKQGQLVAKSMMAGFLQGLAGAFDVNPVPTIQTSDIGSRPIYQNMMSQDALEGAALKGSAKALDRVAKFYLDMAQNMFPVIEIDASRQIEMIVTKGTSL